MIAPPKHPTDPTLKIAAEEIKAILRKHDIAGCVALANGNGHAQYVNQLTPTWSALTVEHTPTYSHLRLRAAIKTAPSEQRALERIRANRTINMIALFRDTCRAQANTMERLMTLVAEQGIVEESDLRHVPHVESPTKE